MSYTPGALVRVRGREWVVLPESVDDLLVLRPLGGTDAEIAGVIPELEPDLAPAGFDPPDPTRVGDHRSGRLLRDALRLGFRSSAGPFRSFGRIAVEPRAYQLVPLLMALRLDPVRLLIADDVGIGKTIEAGLIARELLDQGSAQRLAVLCPPHLAEQWQAELADKFHLDPTLVLAATAARLERSLSIGESIFERHPIVVVSTDFIKSDRHRQEFLRTCPELVIVDEAHTCADPSGGRGRHQRYELVKGLAGDPTRHLLLVTATPHSGNEHAFRALVGLLDPSFTDIADEPTTTEAQRDRRRLARHLVQRRRADIRDYLDEQTLFPNRLLAEQSYTLSPGGKDLQRDVLAFARGQVQTAAELGDRRRERVSWWSALALLRCLASSPAAAAATLRERARTASAETAEEADVIGRRALLDETDDESIDDADTEPGSDTAETDDEPLRAELRTLAVRAEAIEPTADRKLQAAIKTVRQLLEDGFQPIVFCRYIATAAYVAHHLRTKLRGVTVESVTGLLAPVEREARVADLAKAQKRVLVATDCLSEGINLQDAFDAVIHYDLAWNPTRHEQREGRVDRYGQDRPEVRVITIYGSDTPVDGLVLNVLLAKHKRIRDRLGVSIPVPAASGDVLCVILEGLLLTARDDEHAMEQLVLSEELAQLDRNLDAEWESLADRENRARSIYAQATVDVTEVARELSDVREAIGSSAVVERFTTDALRAAGGSVETTAGRLHAKLDEVPLALRDALSGTVEISGRFVLPVAAGERYLSRTDPLVEGLAAHVLDTALDAQAGSPIAARCGAWQTRSVTNRTTLLLLRFRFAVELATRGDTRTLLAEDQGLVAFTGTTDNPAWLAAENLLDSTPAGNVDADYAQELIGAVTTHLTVLTPALEQEALRRAQALDDTHRRVREGARAVGRVQVTPELPVDILGVYVLLPAVAL